LLSIKQKLEKAQEMLDEGLKPKSIAEKLEIHEISMYRYIREGKLEKYKAYDEEEDTAHLYQNFEWLWEEDVLEKITDEAFLDRAFINKDDEDMKCVSRYVRKRYGNIKKYLNKKRVPHLLDCIFVRCRKCGEYRNLREYSVSESCFFGLGDACTRCVVGRVRQARVTNPEKYMATRHNRLAKEKLLPRCLNIAAIEIMLKKFRSSCAITAAEVDIDLDHFIPLSWGHGGSYYENMYPLNASLNRSKNDANPFDWFESAKEERCLSQDAWDNLIRYLSSINGLTTDEYKAFVNWCYENQRTIEEIRADSRPSIEIWREVTGFQFPIRVNFTNPNEIGNRLETA
jgi:hypothetical protein